MDLAALFFDCMVRLAACNLDQQVDGESMGRQSGGFAAVGPLIREADMSAFTAIINQHCPGIGANAVDVEGGAPFCGMYLHALWLTMVIPAALVLASQRFRPSVPAVVHPAPGMLPDRARAHEDDPATNPSAQVTEYWLALLDDLVHEIVPGGVTATSVERALSEAGSASDVESSGSHDISEVGVWMVTTVDDHAGDEE